MSHPHGCNQGVLGPQQQQQQEDNFSSHHNGGGYHHNISSNNSNSSPTTTMENNSSHSSTSRNAAAIVATTFSSDHSGSGSSAVDFSNSSNNISINANVFINNNSSQRGTTNSSLVFSNEDIISPLDVSSLSTTAPSNAISLTLPRPDHQRSSNLYVDTPFSHRPTPRRPVPGHPQNATTTSALLQTSSSSHVNLRSASPLVGVARSHSPSSLSSTFTLHSSSSNLLHGNSASSSTLPSVHRTHAKRSFINPNCASVVNNRINSNNKSTTSSNSKNINNSNGSSNNRNNKLSSSSFSVSSKSRNNLIIQNQPPSFIKGSQFGGSGGVGGKGFTSSKLANTSKVSGGDTISKSVGDLRGSGRRFLAADTSSDGDGRRFPNSITSGGPNFLGESIICRRCGRCRCGACTTPKPPPSAWLCSGKLLCSPASAVDCLSCACCLKAALYHCGGGGEEASHRPRDLGLRTRGGAAQNFSDDDASSTATKELPQCWQRRSRCAVWSCLILGAIPLPCLLCYFPLTALRRLLESGYQKCTNHGCRCPQPPPALPPSASPIHQQPLGLLASPAPRSLLPMNDVLPPRAPLDTRLLEEPTAAPPSPPSLLL